MAVAVKTPPGTPSASSQVKAAYVSLVGVLFVLACLAIVFKLIPDLWWSAWDGLGWGSYPFIGGSLLVLVGLAVAVALCGLGLRLLGPQPAPGVKAGIAVGTLGLVAVVLLARWASLWLEHFSYTRRAFPPATGLIASAVVLGALLVGWLYLFTKPWTQSWVLAMETGGWFSATSYKGNQGQRVRRATMAGILLLVGAGIYTLLSHHVLSRGSPNWEINLPFTGQVAIDSFGDAREFLASLPEAQKNEVHILWGGTAGFRRGQSVGFAAYRDAVEAALKEHSAGAAVKETEPTAFLMAVAKNVFEPKMSALLKSRVLGESASRRLDALYAQTAVEGLGELIPAFRTEALNVNKPEQLGWELNDVPAALLVADRYTLREINDRTDGTKNVKIILPGDADPKKFKEGAIVSLAEFEAEVERLEELRKQGKDRVLPVKGNLTSASGTTTFAHVTVLPSVQFTVPLLLLGASLWLAWRVVNVPAFADFLIATEAEMNKVSWTSQRRLVQDTIVVLVTVVVMSVFLFAMDYTWKIVLSWKPIGVLHIPKDTSQQNKSVEQKRW